MRFGKQDSSAQQIARLFVDHWWRSFGTPARIISDRDTRFTSAWWAEFTRLIGAYPAMTTSFHPQANGQAERTNQQMETVIRAYVDARQSDWYLHLAAAEFAINDSVHSSTGYTPFQLVYGESPLSHLDLFLQNARQEELTPTHSAARAQQKSAARFMEDWRRNLADARLKMERAQVLNKHYYDAKRKHVEYELGDLLLVSKRHLTLPVDRDTPWKLRSLFEGPYKITKVFRNHDEGEAYSYEVDLPKHVTDSGLHNVFTSNKVVPYRDGSKWASQQVHLPTPDTVEGQSEHYVESILKHRDTPVSGRPKKGQARRLKREYLIKWEGLPRGQAQWRTVDKINTGGGVLGQWRAYERALLNQDPALASEEALRIRQEEPHKWLASYMETGSDQEEEEPTEIPEGAPVLPGTPKEPNTGMDHPLIPPTPLPPITGPRRSLRIRNPAATRAALTAISQYEHDDVVVRNPRRRALVLFCGSGSVEKALADIDPNIEIVAIDVDPKSKATRLQDVREFALTNLFDYAPGYFDILWASPPCTEYSQAMTARERNLPEADTLVASALACLLYLKPKYWFLENPDGHLKTRPFMLPFSPYLNKVSYCHYGTPFRKNTNIWSNAPVPELRRCSKETPCTHKKQQGSHPRTAQAGPSGTAAGSGAGKNVYAIPAPLLKELFTPL